METVEFEKLIEKGFEQLPEWVREKIKNVAVLIEDEPSEEVRVREGLREGETLLGYYQGIPLTARGELYGIGITLPDTITIYKRPILAEAEESGEAISKIVADTVWHEFAHYFGMDEDEVRVREEKRNVK